MESFRIQGILSFFLFLDNTEQKRCRQGSPNYLFAIKIQHLGISHDVILLTSCSPRDTEVLAIGRCQLIAEIGPFVTIVIIIVNPIMEVNKTYVNRTYFRYWFYRSSTRCAYMHVTIVTTIVSKPHHDDIIEENKFGVNIGTYWSFIHRNHQRVETKYGRGI